MPKVARRRTRPNLRRATSPLDRVKMSSPAQSSPKVRESQRNPLENLINNIIFTIAAKEQPTRYDVFEDEFLCSKCSNFLHHPLTAPCGHTFCKKCASEQQEVDCRHCQKTQKSSDFTKLNISLDNILEQWYPEQHVLSSRIAQGDNLMKCGSFKEATIKFTQALELNPYDTYALMRRALALKEIGEWKAALADVVSAKIRSKYIPEEMTKCKSSFQFIAERVDTIVQKAVKMFLEVMALLGGKSTPECNSASNTEPFHEKSEKDSSDVEMLEKAKGATNISTLENTSDEKLAELSSGLESIIEGNMSDFETHCRKEIAKQITQDSIAVGDFDELTFCCIVCTRPFHSPVCTPCGHTFCRGCLERCFDHGRTCPMCKTPLTDIYQYQTCLLSVDWSLNSIIKKHFSDLCKERDELVREEDEKLKESLPVFVCTTAFPSIKCLLHVFEPRYRLMIRRAMRLYDGEFGLTIPSATSPYHSVGTVVKIDKVSFYQDGRSIVTSHGVRRFEVEEYGTSDGYNTGKIKYLVDEEQTDENDIRETNKIAEAVYNKAKEWFASCPGHLKSKIKYFYGDFPQWDETQGENGPNWHWWLLASLPVTDDIKVYVLSKTRFRARLAIMKLILNKTSVMD